MFCFEESFRMTSVVLFVLIPLAMTMAAQLNSGKGVCRKVEMKTITTVVQREVVVGTTEIPCVILSFLDELSCMNRPIKTRNVTEMRSATVVEKIPQIVRFCCPGYQLVNGRCSLVTTNSTTTKSTTTKLSSTTTTSPTTTLSTTTTKSTTTKLPTTTRKTTPSTTITTQSTIKSTRKPMRQPSTTSGDQITEDVVTYIKDLNKIVTHSPVKKESNSDPINMKDIMLYVATSCGLVSMVAMVIVIGICYRNSRRNNRGSQNTEIAMETINNIINQTNSCAVQNMSIPTRQGSQITSNLCRNKSSTPLQRSPESIYTARSQNCQNDYTELRMSGQRPSSATSAGSNTYDDLIGFLEDPYSVYDELPDCENASICKNSTNI